MISLPLALMATTEPAATAPLNPNSFLAIGVVVAIIRRKQAIGGWLLFFFWQTFAGCAATIIQCAVNWHSYMPATWSDPNLYLLYMLSFTPRLVSLLSISVVSGILLRTFAWRWALMLRYALIAYIVTSFASFGLDVLYFPADRSITFAMLLFPSIFLIYTYLSDRFRRVFHRHNWYGSFGAATISVIGG